MDREALLRVMADAMHETICSCSGVGPTPLYYDRAARKVLSLVEEATLERADAVNPNEHD